MNEILPADKQLDVNSEQDANSIKSMWTSWTEKTSNGKAALEELIQVILTVPTPANM